MAKFPFLRYLEWVLLGVAFLTSVLHPRPPLALFPVLLLTLAFGSLGLWFPATQPLKIFHTALGFGLTFALFLLGERMPLLVSIYYLILVMRSCLVFSWPSQLIVTGLVFSSFLAGTYYQTQFFIPFGPPHLGHRFPPGFPPGAPPDVEGLVLSLVLNSALLFGAALIFVTLLVNALVTERQSREQLTKANAQLRQYALRIEDQATLQERNRVTRDIHDSLGHSLTALNIQLETALALWQQEPQRAEQFLVGAKQMASRSLQSVRASIASLRADPLQGKNLAEALGILIAEFEQTTGLKSQVEIQLTQLIPSDISTVTYRIIQEGLTNICKHAAAKEIKIKVTEQLGILSVLLQDNGQGFQVENNQSGFGLQGLRERTTAVGSKLEIHSAPGLGCQLHAIFILPEVNR